MNRFSPLRHVMEKGSGDEDIIKVNQSVLSKTEVNLDNEDGGEACEQN